jgi:hypothetical protein
VHNIACSSCTKLSRRDLSSFPRILPY